MPVLRRNAPKRVMRDVSSFLFRSSCSGRSGSFISGTASPAETASLPTVMVRNLVTVNGKAWSPRRVWRKNTGPGELSLTQTATARSSGDVTTRTAELIQRSNARLANRSHVLSWGWAISRNGVPERSERRDWQLINS